MIVCFLCFFLKRLPGPLATWGLYLYSRELYMYRTVPVVYRTVLRVYIYRGGIGWLEADSRAHGGGLHPDRG